MIRQDHEEERTIKTCIEEGERERERERETERERQRERETEREREMIIPTTQFVTYCAV